MLPVQITIRDMMHSPALALESHIRKRAEKLNRFYDRITSCRVVLELAQKHKHQGRLYNVRIDLIVPGKELVVTRKCHEDAYVAIRDAFNALIRQIDEHSHKRHGRVKNHNPLMHGRVVKLLPLQGFGFIQGVDGNEYYFNLTNGSNSLIHRLLIGDAVKFKPEVFKDGWQAQHVIKERHRHHQAA